MNHAIVNPPVDRNKAADQVKDVFISIQKETDAGMVVSGAKVVATSAAITHYNFMGQNAAMPINDSDLAVMFIAPMNAPGVKLFCRTSYEMTASVMGTPYDYPLSSRFDENDAIFVFDNVFIPWENVLVHIAGGTVTDDNADGDGEGASDYDEYVIDDCLRVDDYFDDSLDQPALGTAYSSLTGVLVYTYENFKLAPRSAADLVEE